MYRSLVVLFCIFVVAVILGVSIYYSSYSTAAKVVQAQETEARKSGTMLARQRDSIIGTAYVDSVPENVGPTGLKVTRVTLGSGPDKGYPIAVLFADCKINIGDQVVVMQSWIRASQTWHAGIGVPINNFINTIQGCR